MTTKAIVPFGNSVLRKKARPITDFRKDDLPELLTDMKEILYAAEGRAGLAAPQIGVLKQVIVMDCGSGLIELINPEILVTRGEQTGAEACLSFPGHTGIVKRAKYVKIKSVNRNGQELLLEAEDFPARCIQHEIDHLNGVLYIDHIEGDLLFLDETKQKVSLNEALRMSKK